MTLAKGGRAAAAAALASAALLAGCETVPGAGGPGAEAVPVVQAGGRGIRVTPPDGFCVDRNSILPEAAAAFVLIEDCGLAGAGAVVEGAPRPRPALVNGLVTLSIGPEPLFRGPTGGSPSDWAGLEAFLRSDAGRASAGMGGDPDDIRIVEARREGDTLYVLVEDAGDRVIPVLGDRFWRGFTEVNERAVIASLGVFDQSAMRDEAKLAHLARVVSAIKRGNGDAVGAAEAALAAAAPAPSPAPGTTAAAAAAAAEIAAPAERPEGVATRAAAPEATAGGGLAPAAAPPAPRRPDGIS